MREAVEKVLRALHEDPRRYRPNRKRVEEVARAVAPEENPEVLAEEALKEVRKRVKGVVGGLWRALGAPFPPPPEVGETLAMGGQVEVWCLGGPSGHVLVDLEGKEESIRLPSALRVQGSVALKGSKGGNVALAVDTPFDLFARRGRASFHAQGSAEVEEARRLVRAFRPLFEAMGLPDLEEALAALASLEDRKARREGPYALARKGRRFALRRGSPLGSPPLDGAFLLGEKALLTYAEGLKIAFRTQPAGALVRLLEVEIRWKKATARYRGWSPGREIVEEEVAGALVRETLKAWLTEGFQKWESPRARALVEELARSENPLEAPRDPGFFERVRLRAVALS
jgi:hypothetical protein